MTHINPDDPKWTAYVLNEVDDNERVAIELELESSEEARSLVEELKLAVDLTKVDLRHEVPIVPLTNQERETIQASANVVRPRLWFGARPAVWVTGLAAATVALAIGLAVNTTRFQEARPFNGVIAPSADESRQKKETAATAVIEETKQTPEFGFRYEHPAPKVATGPTVSNLVADARTPGVPSAAAPAAMPAPPPPAPASPPPQVPATAAADEKSGNTATARVFGRVQDPSGAVLPGVTVVATNTQTGAAAAAVTNESGAYALDGLQPGPYNVTGAMPGFKTSIDKVELAATAQAERDIKLQIGQVAQSVDVSVAAKDVEFSSTRAAAPAQPPVQNLRQGALSLAGRAGFAGQQAGQGQQGQQGEQGQQVQQAGNMVPSAAYYRPPRAPGVPPEFDRVRRNTANADAYDVINDNPFLSVAQNPLSTFSIDVDTASYSNVRRYLNQNQLPPRDAVRIEEMINYFTYDYPQPSGGAPIGAMIDAASTPWNPQHRLVRIGIKAKDVTAGRRPPSNLVFLLDVSGSMEPAERLPLLKDGIRMLVEQLTSNDRVTVVTYAGTTGVALQPTRGDQKDTIFRLIGSLQAGGSTNGGSGIQLAYEQAMANFIPGGVNRVILATDGDFNVGITDRTSLLRLIEDKAKSGVFLSVLGVGMGNFKDGTLETLADKGHGNYAYLDTLNEARKVLVDQMSGTLITVAKDVKVQVEFNPAVVDAYRLIGYENRALRNEDFNNDLKDAGDMGAGHTVTVLYEVVPRGVSINAPGIDPLKYQQSQALSPAAKTSNETLNVKVRYKDPTASDSKLLTFPLVDREQTFASASSDFRFAASVASFGMILRDSPFKGTSTIDSVLNMAESSLGSDRNGYRREFLQLVQRARQIRGR